MAHLKLILSALCLLLIAADTRDCDGGCKTDGECSPNGCNGEPAKCVVETGMCQCPGTG